MMISDAVNDVLVSLSKENEFTKDGFIKISDSLLFNKYIVPITSISLIIVGARNISETRLPSIIRIIQLSILLLTAVCLFIFYLKAGRYYKTLYHKDNELLILDGFSHKIMNINISSIKDLNGYDGFNGYFRYMVFVTKNGEKIYFNPNENADSIYKQINMDLGKKD